MLHGYNIEEVFARRFWLANVAYRFPIWPGQDRVHLQLLADYARVDYLRDHRLPGPASPASAPTCRSPSRSASPWSWAMAMASTRHATTASAGMTSTRRSSSSADTRLRSLDATDGPRREAPHLLGIRSYELPETTITTVARAIRSDRRRRVEFMLKFELGLAEPDPARTLGVDSSQLGRRIRAAGNES